MSGPLFDFSVPLAFLSDQFSAPLAFLSGMELFAVSIIVLLLFGTRLPSVMRSLGVGITEFKKGLKGDELTDPPHSTIEDQRRDEK